MSALNAPRMFFEASLRHEWREATIAAYRDLIADAMLGRLVCFSGEPVFERIADALAIEIDVSRRDAYALLQPHARALYRAALAASEVVDG